MSSYNKWYFPIASFFRSIILFFFDENKIRMHHNANWHFLNEERVFLFKSRSRISVFFWKFSKNYFKGEVVIRKLLQVTDLKNTILNDWIQIFSSALIFSILSRYFYQFFSWTFMTSYHLFFIIRTNFYFSVIYSTFLIMLQKNNELILMLTVS